MDKVAKISLDEEYKRDLLGLGEIYEIMSVNQKRLALKKKFSHGQLFLSPNKDHSGRGLTLEEMKRKIGGTYLGRKILEYGYVDCPPWRSAPRKIGVVKRIIYNKPVIFLIKAIFKLLVCFEFFFARPKSAHMIYVFRRNR